MFQSNEEIVNAAIASTLLLILFAMIVILAILKYQNRRRKHFHELTNLKNDFKQEMLKAELEVREQTLNIISQEIHDNVGQVLSLAKLNLSKVLVVETAPEFDKILSTKNLIGKAIQDLRSLSKTLNSQYVSDHSLSQLLQADIELINKTGEYIAHFEIIGSEKPLNSQHQLIIYRIIQEALSNIIKHAKGDHIDISFHYLADQVEVTIIDNGVGFDTLKLINTNDANRGSGVYNMQNRARLVGATFSLESKPNYGTTVKLILPIT
jgi:signal transduction histidine kinase